MRIGRPLALAFAASIPLCSLVAGCGARSTVLSGDPTGQPVALDVYVPDGAGCADAPEPSSAAEVLAPTDPSDEIAVVDLAFAEECTNAGGHYVIGREVDGSRYFWLGGHGCQFLDPPLVGPGVVYGVVRYRITAGLFEIPPEVCVGFGDDPQPVQTEATTEAIAVFETLSEAQAFAASL